MLSRKHRRKFDKSITSAKLNLFVLLNCAFFQTGSNSSVFCSELASRLQQKANNRMVRDLLEQPRDIQKVKQLVTFVWYKN